ncbi:MAG TPA: hypothetical protein VNQ90_20210, partial [Chthoniobacteraceae bacterium]|nr:hypothetical protein [Chthoniobacteraceae bacterium]
RLLAVAIVAMAALLEGIYHTRGIFGGVALVLVAPILIGAITSEAPPVPVLYGRYRPFGPRSRWRLPGPLSWAAGRFLRPGSATGIWFTLLIFTALALTSGIDLGNPRAWRLILSGIGAFLMPLLLARLLFPGKDRFVTWLCFEIFFFVLAILFSITKTLREHWISSLAPPVDFWLHLFNEALPTTDDPGFYLVCGITAGSLLLLVIGSRKEWKKIGELEREARNLESGGEGVAFGS